MNTQALRRCCPISRATSAIRSFPIDQQDLGTLVTSPICPEYQWCLAGGSGWLNVSSKPKLGFGPQQCAVFIDIFSVCSSLSNFTFSPQFLISSTLFTLSTSRIERDTALIPVNGEPQAGSGHQPRISDNSMDIPARSSRPDFHLARSRRNLQSVLHL